MGLCRLHGVFFFGSRITKFLLHFVVVTFKCSWRTRLALFLVPRSIMLCKFCCDDDFSSFFSC